MNFEHVVRTIEHIGEAIYHPKNWIIVSASLWFVNEYIFSQWNFAIGFFMIFILDTMIGTYVAWQMKEFSGYKFRKMLCDKSITYFAIVVSFSIATKITLEDGASLHLDFLNIPFYGILTTVEISSIITSIYRYKKWPWLRPLMKHFQGYSNYTGKDKSDATDK